MCCGELGHVLCSGPIQRKPQRGAAEGRPPLWWRPKAATFALALNKAHVLALNTAHVFRLNKADVLALNKAHVLRRNTQICPVFTANTKEAAFGRLHRGGAAFGSPPFVVCFVLVVNNGRILVVRRKTCALLGAKTSALLRRKTCAVLRLGNVLIDWGFVRAVCGVVAYIAAHWDRHFVWLGQYAVHVRADCCWAGIGVS